MASLKDSSSSHVDYGAGVDMSTQDKNMWYNTDEVHGITGRKTPDGHGELADALKADPSRGRVFLSSPPHASTNHFKAVSSVFTHPDTGASCIIGMDPLGHYEDIDGRQPFSDTERAAIEKATGATLYYVGRDGNIFPASEYDSTNENRIPARLQSDNNSCGPMACKALEAMESAIASGSTNIKVRDTEGNAIDTKNGATKEQVSAIRAQHAKEYKEWSQIIGPDGRNADDPWDKDVNEVKVIGVNSIGNIPLPTYLTEMTTKETTPEKEKDTAQKAPPRVTHEHSNATEAAIVEPAMSATAQKARAAVQAERVATALPAGTAIESGQGRGSG